ncbi:MAG: hydrogenase maturation nickel metallochaperone HypA [Candidatus Marinimicrobia bacterium]|nr:hydrogenase maturation nickel metallochaperone HypA [Candidatus Neomarinimicrobiota bacterium]
MHEFSIASNIVEILKEKFPSPSARIQKINLEVGKLSCLVPESLLFCFDVFRREPLIEKATLEIAHTDGKAFCKNCNCDVVITELYSLCPKCGAFGLEIERGEELKILSVEVDYV